MLKPPSGPSPPVPPPPRPSTRPLSTPLSRAPLPPFVPQGQPVAQRSPAKPDTANKTVLARVVGLVVVVLIVLAAANPSTQRYLSSLLSPSNSSGTTTFDTASLDQANTDKTPPTTDALLPQSFTDSKNVFYTLRSGGVQKCVTDVEEQDVQVVLESAGCTDAIVATYVDQSDQILVTVWVVPLADAATAGAADNQLPTNSDAWGFEYPPQGAGSQLVTAAMPSFDTATQSGYVITSHRYLIHTVAFYITLAQDPGETQWVAAAAWRAAQVVGPLNYPGNH
jgi:hypothetical protein